MDAARAKPRLHVVGFGAGRRLATSDPKLARALGLRCDEGPDSVPPDGPSWPRPRPVRSDLFELASVGFDPNLQLIGGDPWGTSSWAGLIVPNDATPDYKHRYLFLLAWMRLDANRWGRIRGLRTSILLGADVPSTIEGVPYSVEYELQNPFWKAPTGNACFFLQRIPSPGQQPLLDPTVRGIMPSVSYVYSNSPSLLYQSLSPYVPPGNGVPPGVPLSAGLGNFYDNRFGPWRNEDAWSSTDIAVQGPCDIGLFCSVFQMADGQPVPALGTLGLPPDDEFLMNNPTAKFKRVAGAFVWQEDTAK